LEAACGNEANELLFPVLPLEDNGDTGNGMVKKLTKHGNSLALVIDRPILDLLHIDTDTPLDISTDGKRLIVAPAEKSERRQKFEGAQRAALKRYGRAFKKLAG
jgi:antitoxin MazE